MGTGLAPAYCLMGNGLVGRSLVGRSLVGEQPRKCNLEYAAYMGRVAGDFDRLFAYRNALPKMSITADFIAGGGGVVTPRFGCISGGGLVFSPSCMLLGMYGHAFRAVCCSSNARVMPLSALPNR